MIQTTLQNTHTNTKQQNYGQIFILSAFLIAIIITLLAFSLNLVIYSENTSARGSAVAEERALDHQETISMTSQRVMQRYNTDRTYTEPEIQNIGLSLLAKTERDRQQTNSALTTTSYDHSTGTVVGQYSNKDFYPTDSQSTENWTVVSGNPQLYYAQQRIDTDSLNEYATTTIASSGLFSLDPFGTEFSNASGDSYTAEVFKLSGEDTVRLRVRDSSNSYSAPCDVSPIPSTVTIDYVENTVNDVDCPPLSNITQSNWSISYNNSDGAGGQYGLVTSAGPATINSNIDRYQSGGSDPYYANQVTSITLETSYNDSETEYIGQKEILITERELEYIYTP